MQDINSLFPLIHSAQQRLLQMHFRAKTGHIGGNLSCLHSMITLFHTILDEANDTFILSKGHSAGALYITLWTKGILEDKDLDTFHKQDGTYLAGHPTTQWIRQIPFATGSLGHGLSIAAGIALGKKLLHQPGHVFCLTSDGEWQEGSMWEALIFIAHHKLTNLTFLVDLNGLQGFGTTEEVASLSNLYDKFRPFDIDLIEIDGHNPHLIYEALKKPSVKPRCIILRTIKGYGVSFMENKMEWHYLQLNESLLIQALKDLDKSNNATNLIDLHEKQESL